jgi:hypothetical protein
LLAAEADKGEGLRMLVQRAGGNVARTVPKKLPEADTAQVRHAPVAAVSIPLDLGIQTNVIPVALLKFQVTSVARYQGSQHHNHRAKINFTPL